MASLIWQGKIYLNRKVIQSSKSAAVSISLMMNASVSVLLVPSVLEAKWNMNRINKISSTLSKRHHLSLLGKSN